MLRSSANKTTAEALTNAYWHDKKEMKRSVPDISEINGLIGWKPEVGLDEMLQKVIDYERLSTD